MKVYIVFSGCPYEGYDVHSIHKSEELAQIELSSLKGNDDAAYPNNYKIEEHEVIE